MACAEPSSRRMASPFASPRDTAWSWPAAALLATRARATRPLPSRPPPVVLLSPSRACVDRTWRRYRLGGVRPCPRPSGCHLRSGYLLRGESFADLASRAGIDAKGLEGAVAQFNASAVEGRYPLFGKGSRAYNRFQGDALHGPNPCLAPIERGPFSAIRMAGGDLGTYAAIHTDAHARVLRADAEPIPGLYPAGTDIATIMSRNYPRPAIPPRPPLTFGLLP